MAHDVDRGSHGFAAVPAEHALATSLHNTLAVKTKHIDSLVAHVRDLRSKLNHQSQEMAAFSSVAQERESQLRHQNALLSQHVLTLERTVASQERTGCEVLEKVELSVREHVACRSQLDALAARKRKDDEEARNVQDALQLQLSVLRDNRSKGLSGLQQKVRSLESQLKQMFSQLQAVESERATLSEQCSRSEDNAMQERQQCELLREELSAHRQNAEVLEQGREALQLDKTALQRDLHDKIDTVSELRQANNNLVSDCKLTKERCRHLEDQQLEANREAAQRLNEVSLSVKRVVQECENLRTDLGATHTALAMSQRREKELTREVTSVEERLGQSLAECKQLKEALDESRDEVEASRNSSQTDQTESAMYQSLLKDQNELLLTVRHVAEEETARYVKVQEHLEQELKAERGRTLSFSQQIAELKDSVAKYHSSTRSMADLSLDSGLAASTLSLATAAAKVARGSGSASEIIVSLQQDAEQLDIRLTDEMEKHVVTLHRLHAVEEENNRFRLLLAGSPTKEGVQHHHYHNSPGSSVQNSPLSVRSGLLTASYGDVLTASSPFQSPERRNEAARNGLAPSSSPQGLSAWSPKGGCSSLQTRSVYSQADQSLSPWSKRRGSAQQTDGTVKPAVSPDSPSNTVDQLLRSPGNTILSNQRPLPTLSVAGSDAKSNGGSSGQYCQSMPATPNRGDPPVQTRQAWTSPSVPSRRRHHHIPSDASLLAQSLVRRALFPDATKTDLPSRNQSGQGGSNSELAVPLTQSLADRLESLQKKFHEQTDCLRASQAEVASLKVDLDSSEQAQSGLHQQISQLQEDLVAAEQSLAKTAQVYESHQQLLASRTEQLQVVRNELEALRAEQQQASRSMDDIVNLNWPRCEGESLQVCVIRVLEEYYSLQSALKASEQECEKNLASLQQTAREHEQFMRHVEQLKLQHQLDVAKAKDECSAMLKREKTEASREQQLLCEENTLLRRTVEDCNTQVQLLRSANNEEVFNLRQQHQAAFAQQQIVSEEMVDSLNAEIASLKAALEHQQEQLAVADCEHTGDLVKSREESFALFEEEKRILEEKHASLSYECAALKSSVEDYHQQLATLQESLLTATARSDGLLLQLDTERASAKSMSSRLESEKCQLADDCQQFAVQVQDMTAELQRCHGLQTALGQEKDAQDGVAVSLQSSVDERNKQLEWTSQQLVSCQQSLSRWWAVIAAHTAWTHLPQEQVRSLLAEKSRQVFVTQPPGTPPKKLLQSHLASSNQLQALVETLLKCWPVQLEQVSSISCQCTGSQHMSSDSLAMSASHIVSKVVELETSSVVEVRGNLQEVMAKKEQASDMCRQLSQELSRRSSNVSSLQDDILHLQDALNQKSSVPVSGEEIASLALVEPTSSQQDYIEELKCRVKERDELLNKAHEMLESAANEREHLLKSLPSEVGQLPAGQVCRYCKKKRMYKQLNYNRLRLGYCLLELRLYKQVTKELQGRIFQLELHVKLADNQYQLCHEKLLQAEQLGLGDDSLVDSALQSPDKTPVKSPRRRLSSTPTSLARLRSLNLDDSFPSPGATET